MRVLQWLIPSNILLVLIFQSEAELFDAAKGMGIDVDATMGKGNWLMKFLS
jgi:hypothetical protein